MPVVRPPGQGRKARARQRQQFQQSQEQSTSSSKDQRLLPILLHAPFLHGNTMQGRWKGLDHYLSSCTFDNRENDDSTGRLAMDIGMGDAPTTTLEFAAAMGDTWQIVGTECHLDRLQRAQAQVMSNNIHNNVRVAHTGYDFDLSDIVTGEGSQQKPSILRALNVFRDYGLQDTCRGMRKLCAQLATDGGILVEGSASPNGDVWCVLLANHKCEIVRVLFGTTLPLLNELCWPEEFRKCLPRLWRNYVQTNHHHHHPWWIQPIAHLLDEEWKHTACSFADSLKDVPNIEPAWMEHGILVWQPPHPIQIPRAEETNLKHA